MRIPHITLLFGIVCLVTADEPQKRMPPGFIGVRGKRSIPDKVSDLQKRVSPGFVGVRGKRSIPDTEYDNMQEEQKRAPAGFLGVRGKKPCDVWMDEKRAPSAGFLGMRGKKESDSELLRRILDDRVMKEYFPGEFKIQDIDGVEQYYDKRAPGGFLGMRGKKDLEPFDGDVKRAPSPGFLGMRGKKPSARSGFYGMRGKKYPYEFRGKFVGVRGKKASELMDRDNAELIRKFGNSLDINQLMLLLTENDSYKYPDAFSQEYIVVN